MTNDEKSRDELQRYASKYRELAPLVKSGQDVSSEAMDELAMEFYLWLRRIGGYGLSSLRGPYVEPFDFETEERDGVSQYAKSVAGHVYHLIDLHTESLRRARLPSITIGGTGVVRIVFHDGQTKLTGIVVTISSPALGLKRAIVVSAER